MYTCVYIYIKNCKEKKRHTYIHICIYVYVYKDIYTYTYIVLPLNIHVLRITKYECDSSRLCSRAVFCNAFTELAENGITINAALTWKQWMSGSSRPP